MRHAFCFSLLLLAIASTAFAQEGAPQAVIVETADGSRFAGTLPAGFELTIVSNGVKSLVAARDLRRVMVSSLRETDVAALEAKVNELGARLGADSYRVREQASAELAAMTGPIAPFVARLTESKDPEIVARAHAALKNIAARGEFGDARDLVQIDTRLLRGWVELDSIALTTELGIVAIPRAHIRVLRHPGAPADMPRSDDEAALPPPLAQDAPDQLVDAIELRGGTRLTGDLALETLALVDLRGDKLDPGMVTSLARDAAAEGIFEVTLRDGKVIRARFDTPGLAVAAATRAWTIPAALIERVAMRTPRGQPEGATLAALVGAFLRAKKCGGELPTQRFWVRISDQPANPWNSAGKKGMTWRLLDVHEQVALVGADKATSAYVGDTSIDEALPILCLRPLKLPAPPGVDASDFYRGWSGGEIRLTAPIAGKELTSLEAANAIIRKQFGPGWEMAPFHSPSGGWHWWGYWTKAPAKDK